MNARLAAVAATCLLSSTGGTSAYPIDCAILLCIAGGFPPSAECASAKAEVVRRITPWPIEPPLQIWRCPMGTGGKDAATAGADDIPMKVEAYRDGIELWELSKLVTTGSGGRNLYLGIVKKSYDPTGRFVRQKVDKDDWPDWLDPVVRQYTGSTLQNEYGRSFRAILLRMRDYTGTATTEWFFY